METTAKLFKNGRSQAVRLPKSFRFEGDAVKIYREGQKVIMEPIRKNQWDKGFWAKFSPDKSFKTPKPLPSKPFDLDMDS
ncbi:MAG: type II toxin-antitoxin system VapB family antitoxin [Desulfobacterales bacterium]|nr:type II toxin-antitoxin system VapB family antitoxin [Desulfobacterales bacterium]